MRPTPIQTLVQGSTEFELNPLGYSEPVKYLTPLFSALMLLAGLYKVLLQQHLKDHFWETQRPGVTTQKLDS